MWFTSNSVTFCHILIKTIWQFSTRMIFTICFGEQLLHNKAIETTKLYIKDWECKKQTSWNVTCSISKDIQEFYDKHLSQKFVSYIPLFLPLGWIRFQVRSGVIQIIWVMQFSKSGSKIQNQEWSQNPLNPFLSKQRGWEPALILRQTFLSAN